MASRSSSWKGRWNHEHIGMMSQELKMTWAKPSCLVSPGENEETVAEVTTVLNMLLSSVVFSSCYPGTFPLHALLICEEMPCSELVYSSGLVMPFSWARRSKSTYWVGQKVHLVFAMKDTFFIFHQCLDWSGYFEYVSCLLGGITLLILSVSVWSLSTSASLTDCGASSSENSAARNWANRYWHIPSGPVPSPYTALTFFVCLLLPFLK